MADEEAESPGLHYVLHMARHATEVTGKSNTRRQQGITGAIYGACKFGLRFARDDFERIRKLSISGALEEIYTAAATARNVSACISLERSLGRPAICLRDRTQLSAHGPRIGVGHQIFWRGYYCQITSIQSAGKDTYFVATYKAPDLPGKSRSRRFQIPIRTWNTDPQWPWPLGENGLSTRTRIEWQGSKWEVAAFSDDGQRAVIQRLKLVEHDYVYTEETDTLRLADWVKDFTADKAHQVELMLAAPELRELAGAPSDE